MQVKPLSVSDTESANDTADPAPAWAWLNQPVTASAIALFAWAEFVIARWRLWAHGQLTLFIMSGVKYSHPGQMRPPIGHVPFAGYDGQFYYRFARDPFNWQHTAYGITVDHNYRYTRLGYPLVTWLLSGGGHPALVPVTLIAVNLACVAAIAWLGARFARDSGRHALWGLLFAAYFGLVISVGRDMSEPLADTCLLGSLLAYRRGRHILAAALLAFGVITNEPVLIMGLAIAVTRLWRFAMRRARPGREDLIWVMPGAAYVILQVLEKIFVPGKAGGAVDVTRNITLPFWAMTRGVLVDLRDMSWTHLGQYDYNLIEFIALATVTVSALTVIRRTTAPVHERAGLLAFTLIEIVMASWQFWGSTFGDGRTYIDAYLLALIVLLGTPKTTVTNRRLSLITTIAVATLVLIARRRILFE